MVRSILIWYFTICQLKYNFSIFWALMFWKKLNTILNLYFSLIFLFRFMFLLKNKIRLDYKNTRSNVFVWCRLFNAHYNKQVLEPYSSFFPAIFGKSFCSTKNYRIFLGNRSYRVNLSTKVIKASRYLNFVKSKENLKSRFLYAICIIHSPSSAKMFIIKNVIDGFSAI